jgi:hypothetical protein
LGDTVTRLEAKLVLRTDLAAAEKGISQLPPSPDGWRFLLIDARTGEPYVGGASVEERPWWSGLRDRSSDLR